MIRLVAFLVAFTACAPLPPTPPGPISPLEPHACFADPQPTAERICVGVFTEDGHACAACAGAEGCISVSVEVYCAKGGSCALDPACHTLNGKPLVQASRSVGSR